MEDSSRLERLRLEFKETIQASLRQAKKHYWFAHLTFAAAVFASFVTTVCTVFGSKGIADALWISETVVRIFLTAVAVLPATVLVLNNTVRFEERSRWFWRKARGVEALLRELDYSENPDVGELARAFNKLCDEMEREWPTLSMSPVQPTSFQNHP